MKIFTVGELNRVIKNLIDNEVILEDVTVTGELSSFSVTRSIAYFNLKDADNILSCVQFNCKAEYQIGDMVECRGNIKYYPKGGKLSLNVLSMKLCGQGELYLRFLELKEKLEREGLFDESHKVPLPKFIRSVGVVTSATGAVIQDIKNIALRRNPNLEILLYDAQVQGKLAVQQIIEGISYFDNFSDVDCIILARGGGSIEDLSPFNDESLARVIFYCNKPVISAVGHETDFTIADFVSDLRAPTPSAGAELVTFIRDEVVAYIRSLFDKITSLTDHIYKDYKQKIFMYMPEIDNAISSILDDEILGIFDRLNRIESSMNDKYSTTRHSVDIVLNTLNTLNPAKLLSMGYSSVTINNEPVKYNNIYLGDEVNILTNEMKLIAKVTKKEKL